MGGFGQELVRSAREALAIATGEMEPAQVRRFRNDDVRTLRRARESTPASAPATEVEAAVPPNEAAGPREG